MWQYYVYMMTNKRKSVLYIGVTSDLHWRILEHKEKHIDGFTKKYNVNTLIYYEEFQYVNDAIRREKQLKGWRRSWKNELIKQYNPLWKDLSSDWYDRDSGSSPE